MRVVVKRERGTLRGLPRSFTRRLCSATEAWMAAGQEAQLWVIQSSPRGTALPLYRRCTRLPGAFPLHLAQERGRARELGGRGAGRRELKRGTWGGEREDVSAGFPPPLMGMRYELFVGCSLAFSHCYATVLLASASPSCTPTKRINVNAHCRAVRPRENAESWNNDWEYIISANADQNALCYNDRTKSRKFYVLSGPLNFVTGKIPLNYCFIVVHFCDYCILVIVLLIIWNY